MSSDFKRAAATDARLLKRSAESLIGICQGVLVDGELADQEITFLKAWLDEHSAVANTWPAEVLYRRITAALDDGQITPDERDHLRETISEIAGGDFQATGATGGLSSKLPIEDVDTIVFPDSLFCFTGQFLFGTRQACQRAVEAQGAVARPNVTMQLNYLVIGTLSNPEWAHSSYGRKIEKAVAYRDRGLPIAIISEQNWLQFLPR